MQNIVLVGDSTVGKSSFVLKLARDAFTESYISTIGKEMTVVDDIIIHDTAGNPRFSKICCEYYKHANGALIFFDVHKTEKSSVIQWIEKLRKENEFLPIILVGNKIDNGPYNKIDVHNIKTMYISCKTGENINEVIVEIKKIMTKISLPETWFPWSYCWLQ